MAQAGVHCHVPDGERALTRDATDGVRAACVVPFGEDDADRGDEHRTQDTRQPRAGSLPPPGPLLRYRIADLANVVGGAPAPASSGHPTPPTPGDNGYTGTLARSIEGVNGARRRPGKSQHREQAIIWIEANESARTG